MQEMTYKELAEKHDGEGFRVIDVREPDEYEQVHVKGVELFPLSRLRRGERPERDDRPVAVICRSGSRSRRACQLLESEGWDECINVSDGTQGAVREGDEHVVRDDESPDPT